MRYLVLMAACKATEIGQHLCAHHDAAEGQRLGEAEAARRWPESEGWRGHTVSVREDREHSRCIVVPDFAAAFAAVAGIGRGASSRAPVAIEAQELETIA
jgi:DNA-binding IclR family transcriptional regulator